MKLFLSSRNTLISSPVQNNRVGEWIKSSSIFAIIWSLFCVLQLQFEMLGRKEAASCLVISSDLLAAAWCQCCVEQSVPEPLTRCFHLHIPDSAVPQLEVRCGLIFRPMARWENEAPETLYTCDTWAALHTSKSWRKLNHISTAPCVCTLGSTSRAYAE